MANPRKALTKESKFNYAHGNNLFEALGSARLRTLIEKLFPETSITAKTNGLSMNCLMPNHQDVHPSFFINLNDSYAKCFSCGYFSKNLLQLLQDAKGFTFKDSVQHIQNIVGYRIVTERHEKDLEALDVHQQAYKLIFDICNNHLLRCISGETDEEHYVPALIHSAKPALTWLFETRGHNKEMAPFLPYGLMPPQHLLLDIATTTLENKSNEEYAKTGTTTLSRERRKLILDRIRLLIEKVDGSWINAVTFHTGYGLTTPGRLRLRRPTDESKGENIMVLPGFSEDDPLGIFGLYSKHFSAFTPKEREEMVFIGVEGENDAITVQENIFASGLTGKYVLAFGGNANTTDVVFNAGVLKLYLMSDHPDPEIGKGEEWVKARLSTAQATAVYVFNKWDELRQNNLLVKDPDDAIRHNGFALFKQLAIDTLDNFIPAHIWAGNRASEAIADIPIDEVRQRLYCAADYGRCIKLEAELSTFVSRMETTFNIPSGPLRNEIVKFKDTEEGFIQRIVDTLKHEYHILYRVPNSRGGELVTFSKRSKCVVSIPINDAAAAAATLSKDFGDLYSWFRDHIGLPPTYVDDNTVDLPHSTLIKEKQRDIEAYLRIAMQTFGKGVPDKDTCIRLNQGIFLIEDPANPLENILLLINGKHCYLGRWLDPLTSNLTWVELEGPSYQKYLFNQGSQEPWSEEITSVEDLNQANSITLDDIKQVYEDVYLIYNKHWKFMYHEEDCRFLATHLMACAATAAFPTKVILAFIGLTGSGKSTAMSLFAGGQYPALKLLEASLYQASYTMASLYQAFDETSLMMVLEEFTSDTITATHKSRQVEDINELLRQVIFEGGSKVSRGTTEGKARSYHLHTNVAVSSITAARDPQDENRRYTINTVRVPSLKDPSQALFRTITKERFKQMKRILTLGLLKYNKQLKELHDELSVKFNTEDIVDFPVPSRYLRNFIPGCSILSLLGIDWRAFVQNCCTQRKQVIESTALDNPPQNLMNTILLAPLIPVAKGFASVQTLLTNENEISLINASQVGIFYDEATKILIVEWNALLNERGALGKNVEYNRMGRRGVKHTLDQHESIVHFTKYDEIPGLSDFLERIGLFSDANISVLNISSIVDKLRKRGPLAEVREFPSNVLDFKRKPDITSVNNI